MSLMEKLKGGEDSTRMEVAGSPPLATSAVDGKQMQGRSNEAYEVADPDDDDDNPNEKQGLMDP